ncbi:MAG: hypothetical protein E7214_02410 [Clostridium sp.]|nr:hypothetical protein [Clostridium sp.]
MKKLNNMNSKGLKKRRGDDKLVISLVLIAVGVLLCFVYKDKISESIGTAVTTLNEKINELFNDQGRGSSTGLFIIRDNF